MKRFHNYLAYGQTKSPTEEVKPQQKEHQLLLGRAEIAVDSSNRY